MLIKVLAAALFILYPAAVYFGLTHGMAWLGLTFLAIFFLYRAYFSAERRRFSIFMVLVLLIGMWLQQEAMVKFIPIIIHATLFLLFFQSLRLKQPIIEKFAKLDFPVLPEGMAEHCLFITRVWAIFFALNILINIGMIFWFPHAYWALYNGVIVYVLIGFLVIGEYGLRKRRFAHVEMPSFRDTVITISKHSKNIFEKKDV